MKANIVFIAVLLCMAIAVPCSAQNMSISRLGAGSMETVQIYNGSTLEGTYNTSSNGIELPTGDFLLVIKPVTADPLSDPGQWMEDTLDWITTNITAILLACFLIGLIFWRR